MKKFYLLLTLLILIGCNVEERMSENSAISTAPLSINADFIKLADNYTGTAATLLINSTSSELKVKWDLPEGCNIDTTVTTLSVSNGQCELPVKWDKRMSDGMYGPTGMGYSGGVLISSDELSQYVPIFWADEVDTLLVRQQLKEYSAKTRSMNEVAPIVDKAYIALDPQLLELDKDTCGTTKVQYAGSTICSVDYTTLQESDYNVTDLFNLDLTQIRNIRGSKGTLPFTWKGGVASDSTFMAHVKLKCVNFVKYAYVRYQLPEPKEWIFVKSVPVDKGYIDAVDGAVRITVRTNRKWSASSDLAIHSPVNSPDNTKGEQTIVVEIENNPSTSTRPVKVNVESEEGDKIELNFTQRGLDGTMTVVSVSPESDDVVLSTEHTFTANVETTTDWWIAYNGQTPPNYFPASQKTGTFKIGVNESEDPRPILIEIGHGENPRVVVKTVIYIQNPGGDLYFVDTTLPSPTIPAIGGTWYFNFKGTYKGPVQMLVTIDGDDQPNKPTTDKSPSVLISPNTASFATRTITFKYRKGTEAWTDEGLTVKSRVQDGATLNANLTSAADILGTGETVFCDFTGTYTGNIIFRATPQGAQDIRAEGEGAQRLSVNIPPLPEPGIVDRNVVFDYSVDGGNTWKPIMTKKQSAGTIIYSVVKPEGILPAGKTPVSSIFSGSYKGTIRFHAKDKTTGEELGFTEGTQIGSMGFDLKANAKTTNRTVVFEYSRDAGQTWVLMEERIQKGSMKVDSDKTNVNDYNGQQETTVGKDL